MATKHPKPPWEHPKPKADSAQPTHHLSAAEKAAAKRSAAKAGRPYPNLVDNMRVAAKHKRKAT